MNQNSINPEKKMGYRWTILFVIWLLYIINYFDRISVLVFLPYIQKDLSLFCTSWFKFRLSLSFVRNDEEIERKDNFLSYS